MKTRFNTYDIVCMVAELQRLIGMRVNQVYDIDNRSYLIRLQRSEEKAVLLLESGNRFHTTQFEWPKNVAPSGFTMKLRKHLKNKRLEKLTQFGIDRIVELQFGSGEAAYHVILELYDRGNIVLTDHEWTILNVLRPHVEGDKIRFAVKEKYPLDRAKVWSEPPLGDKLKEILGNCRPGDNLKKILNPNVEYGPAVIDHVLLLNGLSGNMKVSKDQNKGFQIEKDMDKLDSAIRMAEELMLAAKNGSAKGYIIQKKEERPTTEGDTPTYILTNIEFHPFLFEQHKESPLVEYDSFDRAVDEFFSAVEGQKIDIKTIQLERDAMKKLQNVRKDHEKRVTELEKAQHEDREKAELITRNLEVVNNAMMAVHNALANQVSWDTISTLIKEAQDNNDPTALTIKKLKLETNHITLELFDPYEELDPMLVDVDLSLTAYANATRYYDHKRSAAKKQQKTIESQGKALKSAERKTKQTLKEAQTISSISKARKTYWFEKFYWFISSDNYLVISGRDQQQNELLVKRYLRANDLYVHADVSGASSVIIKGGVKAPKRTLHEAGQAAVAYSVAWEAKVLTTAWWVHAHQVSKSAPTGEYLTTGSFMIRGKKNYLLPQHLQMGFGFMFRLEESCIEKHKSDRKPQMLEDTSEVNSVQDTEEGEQEIVVSDDDDHSDTEDKQKETLQPITEEPPKEESNDPEDPESGSETDSSESYPDTHIKVDHATGQVVTESKIRSVSETSDATEEKPLSFPSLPKKNQNKKPQNQKQVKFEPKKEKEGMKRGQKGKLKKIKEKYKNQDEDERALRTQLLQSSNTSKSKKNEKKNATSGGKSKNKVVKIPQPTPQLYEAEDDEVENENDPQDLPEGEAVDELSEMLYQLTGVPSSEDELLFAVPVVAPYSTLLGYKFKVKLTPGTSKRGKAAKTAVQVFLKDPNSSSRERDLLKAVKEENIARNFPGKVKLSAPNLHKHKK